MSLDVSKRMTHKQTKQDKDPRARILEVAETLFLEKGYQKTSLREVARKAEVNLGLLSYYFKTKDMLAGELHFKILYYAFEQIELSQFKIENSIQRMFIMFILCQYELMKVSSFLSYNIEVLLKELDTAKPSKISVQLITAVIEEYGLTVDEKDRLIAVRVMRGIERNLVKAKVEEGFDISFLEINKVMIISTLTTIGIPLSVLNNEYSKCLEMLGEDTIEALVTG